MLSKIIWSLCSKEYEVVQTEKKVYKGCHGDKEKRPHICKLHCAVGFYQKYRISNNMLQHSYIYAMYVCLIPTCHKSYSHSVISTVSHPRVPKIILEFCLALFLTKSCSSVSNNSTHIQYCLTSWLTFCN